MYRAYPAILQTTKMITLGTTLYMALNGQHLYTMLGLASYVIASVIQFNLEN